MPILWVKQALKEEPILQNLEIQKLPTDETITAVEPGTINILSRCSPKWKCSLLLCELHIRISVSAWWRRYELVPGMLSRDFAEHLIWYHLGIRVGRGEVLHKDGRKGNWECQGMSVSELYCNSWLCWNHTASWWWKEQKAAEADMVRKLGLQVPGKEGHQFDEFTQS